MLTDAIIQQLKLEEKCSLPGSTQYRIFHWPEFSEFKARIMECSLDGHRLPKSYQAILVYFRNDTEHRVIISNEHLQNFTHGLRFLMSRS